MDGKVVVLSSFMIDMQKSFEVRRSSLSDGDAISFGLANVLARLLRRQLREYGLLVLLKVEHGGKPKQNALAMTPVCG